MKFSELLSASSVALVLLSASASAATYNLPDPTTSIAIQNGLAGNNYLTTFTAITDKSIGAGTGVLQPFLQIQGDASGGVEQGYNAPGRTPQVESGMDINSNGNNPFMKAIQLGNLLTSSGVEMVLDINESSGGGTPPKSQISIDSLRLFASSTANIGNTNFGDGSTPFSGAATELWNLGSNSLVLDCKDLANCGSGWVDMKFLFDKSIFTGLSNKTFLVLYAKMGVSPVSEAGFEEFAAVKCGDDCTLTPVPLPAAGWLMFSALGGLGFAASRRRRRKAS